MTSIQTQLDEFGLIERFFTHRRPRKDVILGVGDDSAILSVPDGRQLLITTDTLVSGTHFFADTDPRLLAFKSVAVNLSDLAAMGGEPAWMTLAITLPEVDTQWLSLFADGLQSVCDYYGVALVGGDTTRGPLSITITMHGTVPSGRALRRDGAKVGDWIYVTGNLGSSAAGLYALQRQLGHEWRAFIEHHLSPKPRLAAGIALRGLASSALDLSDGLASDLGHILQASKVGAVIDLDKLPICPELQTLVGQEQALQLALGGGEDYELLFTVPDCHKSAITTALSEISGAAVCVGQIVSGNQIGYRRDGLIVPMQVAGFNHFHGPNNDNE